MIFHSHVKRVLDDDWCRDDVFPQVSLIRIKAECFDPGQKRDNILGTRSPKATPCARRIDMNQPIPFCVCRLLLGGLLVIVARENVPAQPWPSSARSIREFGVSSTNTAEAN